MGTPPDEQLIARLPEVHLEPAIMEQGRLSERLATRALEAGPILRYRPQMADYEGPDLIFMVGPEANRFVLHSHRHLFSHDRGWTPVLGAMLGRGLLNMDDPPHDAHRRLWNPAFSRTYMESYVPIMLKVIEERCAHWVEQGTIDLLHEAREITFDIAAIALAGFDAPAERDQLRHLFYTLLHGADTSEETEEEFLARIEPVSRELVTLLLELIAKRRATPPEQAGGDVLARIVHARDESGEVLSDEQVLGHVNILLVAGHETTTTLGAWTLYKLAQKAPGSRRVRGELDSLLADQGQITVESTREMIWLDRFVREVGRLYPPVHLVPRGVLAPFEFGGYEIPADGQLRLALGATHRLPGLFAHPDRFDPDRFAPPREEDRQPYSLVTFGGGPQVCIGINFALFEVKVLAAYVLRHFVLEPIEPEPVHGGYFTAYLPDGIHATVRRR